MLCEHPECNHKVLEVSYWYDIPKRLCPFHKQAFQVEFENNKELRSRLLEEYVRRTVNRGK